MIQPKKKKYLKLNTGNTIESPGVQCLEAIPSCTEQRG